MRQIYVKGNELIKFLETYVIAVLNVLL